MARTPLPSVVAFDPNVAPQGSNIFGIYDGFAFYLGNRSRIIQKSHNKSECSVWELVGGVWVLRGMKTPKTDGDCCDDCGQPFKRIQHPYYRNPHTELDYHWEYRRQSGKIAPLLQLLALCSECSNWNR